MQLMIPLIIVSLNDLVVVKHLKKQFPKTYIIDLQPEKTEYSINQIRTIIAETITLQPRLRVYHLASFDNSSLAAQNAFLKTLEEPPSNVQFVLSVRNEYKLIPTIRSRSRIVYLGSKNSQKIISIEDNLLNEILKKGNRVLNHKNATVTNKEQALEQIDNLIITLKSMVSSYKYAGEMLRECLRSRKLVDENNASPQLSLDHLLIFLTKLYSMKE